MDFLEKNIHRKLSSVLLSPSKYNYRRLSSKVKTDGSNEQVKSPLRRPVKKRLSEAFSLSADKSNEVRKRFEQPVKHKVFSQMSSNNMQKFKILNEKKNIKDSLVHLLKNTASLNLFDMEYEENLKDDNNANNKMSKLDSLSSNILRKSFSRSPTRSPLKSPLKSGTIKRNSFNSQNESEADFLRGKINRSLSSNQFNTPEKRFKFSPEFKFKNQKQLSNTSLNRKESMNKNDTISSPKKTLKQLTRKTKSEFYDSSKSSSSDDSFVENVKSEEKENKISKNAILIMKKSTEVDKNPNQKEIKAEPLLNQEQIKHKNRLLIRRKNVYDSLSETEIEDIIANFFVINPKSEAKIFWDFLIYISLVYSLFTIPIQLGFINEDCIIYPLRILFKGLDLIIDLLFSIDILLSFFLGYYDSEENIIYNQNKIFKNYVTGFLWIDSLSALPFNTLISLNVMSGLNERWFRMFRLIKCQKVIFKSNTNSNHNTFIKRIYNVIPVKKYFYKSFDIPHKTKKLIDLIIYFGLICHILTGIWLYLALLSPSNNWSVYTYDMKCQNEGLFYVDALYFTMTTLFTIGYGDIYPTSILEKTYSVFLLLFALIIYSLAVSLISNFAIYKTSKLKELERNMDYLQELTFVHGIPYEIYKNTLDYLKYSYQSNKNDNNQFLFELPTTLRNEVICEMYKDIIHNFKFFNYPFSQDSIVRIILALRPVGAYKGEVLIKKDTFIEEIIFIKQGRLSFSTEYKGVHVKLMDIGRYEHFGEYLLFRNKRSPVNISVKSDYCELFLLRKIDLVKITDFKDIFKRLIKKSRNIIIKIKNDIRKNKKSINLEIKKKMKSTNVQKANNEFAIRTPKSKGSSKLKVIKDEVQTTLNHQRSLFLERKESLNIANVNNISNIKKSNSIWNEIENKINDDIENKDLKVNENNKNYYKNLNISNKGNLFINFNLNSPEHKNSTNSILNPSTNNVLNLNSDNFSNIFINYNQNTNNNEQKLPKDSKVVNIMNYYNTKVIDVKNKVSKSNENDEKVKLLDNNKNSSFASLDSINSSAHLKLKENSSLFPKNKAETEHNDLGAIEISNRLDKIFQDLVSMNPYK